MYGGKAATAWHSGQFPWTAGLVPFAHAQASVRVLAVICVSTAAGKALFVASLTLFRANKALFVASLTLFEAKKLCSSLP
jgi:hypothetical protein